MDRRGWFRSAAAFGTGVGLAGLGASLQTQGQEKSGGGATGGARDFSKITIRDVKAIMTQPSQSRLIVVKVETSEPGLYGLGCATFTQRGSLVAKAVDDFLKPFLVGKNALEIEDIWQSSFVSSYWRNGPVLYNAISGVDMALWDILGKVSGLPVYRMLGGKARKAVDVYRHASGKDFKETEDQVKQFMAEGYRHIRAHVSVEGQAAYGAKGSKGDPSIPENRRPLVFEPRKYALLVPKLFEHLRKTCGEDVELLHDVHERVPPILAIQMCKDVEPYRLFFLEDPFSPEDVGYFEHLRRQTSTPLAMGELFNNPNEFVHLISGRLIDFIRVHLSQIGGLTPGRKLAAFCEYFAVRTAWHGPGDVSPVGHAANIHIDIAVPNFGVQEARFFTEEEKEVFPGCPELKDGYYWVSDRPGLGVDLDEKAAAKYPIKTDPPFDQAWGNYRKPDGTVIKP